MAAEKNLFDCSREHVWQKVLKLYPRILKLKAETKSKPAAKKELVILDSWFQNELPKIIKDRTKPHITLEELEKLMKWKLSRGKFRPMLPKLIASNKPADVINASTKAFEKLPKIRDAIQALSVLRGVGPATASDSSGEWTAHKVELAVWTDVMGRQLDPTLLESAYSDDSPPTAANGESRTEKRRSKSIEGRDPKRSKKSRARTDVN